MAYRVKVFRSTDAEKLETIIDTWLKNMEVEAGPTPQNYFLLKDIKFVCTVFNAEGKDSYAALAIYQVQTN